MLGARHYTVTPPSRHFDDKMGSAPDGVGYEWVVPFPADCSRLVIDPAAARVTRCWSVAAASRSLLNILADSEGQSARATDIADGTDGMEARDGMEVVSNPRSETGK